VRSTGPLGGGRSPLALLMLCMKRGSKVLVLELLAVGYAVLFLHEIISSPRVYCLLLAMFGAGAAMTLFMEGPQYGTIDPISTRPAWVGLGLVIMGAALLFSFSIRSQI
jgi:hypothetical protein